MEVLCSINKEDMKSHGVVGVERMNERKNRTERGGETEGQREGQWGQRYREKDSKSRKEAERKRNKEVER